MEPIRIKDVMTRAVVSLDVDHSINLAEGLMRMQHIRHLPVVHQGKLVGLVTHRDLVKAQAAILTASSLPPEELNVPVERIMQREVWTAHPETPALHVAQIMVSHKYGCAPVVENDHLVGIVTQIDLLSLLVRILAEREGL
jgi:CBS domain-containing protein